MSAETIVAILGAVMLFLGFVLVGVFASWIVAGGIAFIIVGNTIHLELLYMTRWEEREE